MDEELRDMLREMRRESKDGIKDLKDETVNSMGRVEGQVTALRGEFHSHSIDSAEKHQRVKDQADSLQHQVNEVKLNHKASRGMAWQAWLIIGGTFLAVILTFLFSLFRGGA